MEAQEHPKTTLLRFAGKPGESPSLNVEPILHNNIPYVYHRKSVYFIKYRQYNCIFLEFMPDPQIIKFIFIILAGFIKVFQRDI